MPYSNGECRDWTVSQIAELAPSTILDVGPGFGTYARALDPVVQDCKFIGIEIFEPYVERFDLKSWYDEIIIGDARTVDFPQVDVVIFGDVLEHMTYPQALDVLDRARLTARQAVFVSVPIIHYPQGAWEGNEHEAHLHTWDHSLGLSLPGVMAWTTGVEIGAYRLSPAVS